MIHVINSGMPLTYEKHDMYHLRATSLYVPVFFHGKMGTPAQYFAASIIG